MVSQAEILTYRAAHHTMETDAAHTIANLTAGSVDGVAERLVEEDAWGTVADRVESKVEFFDDLGCGDANWIDMEKIVW